MDVGQVIGTTTEQPRRESEPRREESDEFATFLNEPAPKQEAPVKKKATQTEPVVEEPTADQPANTASRESVPESAAPLVDQKAQASDTKPSPVATPAPAVPASNTVLPQVVPKPANTQTVQPAHVNANEAPINEAAAAIAKPEPSKATVNAALAGGSNVKPAADPIELMVQTTVPAPVEIAKQAKSSPVTPTASAAPAASTAPANSADKTATIGTPGAKPTPVVSPVVSDALTTVRTDADAKMSKNDILSTKIAEMLKDGKGKISLNASSQQQSFQSALASSTNLVTASMAGNPAAAALNTLSGAVNSADSVIPQVTPTVTANAGGLPVDTVNPTVPTTPTGSVQGVEATSTNTTSQAANAARASAQLPVAEQVSTQISAAIKEGHDRIKISLHPSELGRVEVKLDIGHDGRILAVVAVDKQETLDMLQRDARTLEKALQDAGFDTGSGSLNFGLRQDAQGEGRDFADLDLPLGDMADEDDLSMLSQRTPTGGTQGDGSLDIQV
ncbi:MAG: flagellar hook-length control protein FliK [Sneathiella sp.]